MWQGVACHHCPVTSEAKDTENWKQKALGLTAFQLVFHVGRVS